MDRRRVLMVHHVFLKLTSVMEYKTVLMAQMRIRLSVVCIYDPFKGILLFFFFGT